jgi:YHS domain-containing protein
VNHIWSKVFSLVVVALAFSASAVGAQEGDKQPPLALEGHCPVCLVKANKWVQGKAEHAATYDGRTYRFPSENEKKAFLEDPAKFAPALNGDCIVCLAKGGVRQAGSIQHTATHAGRVYLFPGPKEKEMFIANPIEFAKADLAAGGNCVVCKILAGKDVPGKPEFTALHNGLRYQFPSDKERQMFLENPAKFLEKGENKQSSDRQQPAASAKLVSVVGITSCAACEHGVQPLGAPNELGLAVKGVDGKVYVVEDAHKLYSDIYGIRCDGVKVELKGTPIQTKEKIVWVRPQSVSRSK